MALRQTANCRAVERSVQMKEDKRRGLRRISWSPRRPISGFASGCADTQHGLSVFLLNQWTDIIPRKLSRLHGINARDN